MEKTSEGVLEYSYAEYEEMIKEALWDGLLNSYVVTTDNINRVYVNMPSQVVAEIESNGFTVTGDASNPGTGEEGVFKYTITKNGVTFYLSIDTTTGQYELTSDLDE